MLWNAAFCIDCEEDFTEAACPTCGWEYEPPDDYAEVMAEQSVRAREFRLDQHREITKALLRGD